MENKLLEKSTMVDGFINELSEKQRTTIERNELEEVNALEAKLRKKEESLFNKAEKIEGIMIDITNTDDKTEEELQEREEEIALSGLPRELYVDLKLGKLIGELKRVLREKALVIAQIEMVTAKKEQLLTDMKNKETEE